MDDEDEGRVGLVSDSQTSAPLVSGAPFIDSALYKKVDKSNFNILAN